MSTSEPLDPQRYGETQQPGGPPTDLEATLPLASPPQPIAPVTSQAVAPLPATRQTLPPPIPSAPINSRRSPLGWLVLAGALVVALIVASAGVNAWEASQPTATVAAFCGALKGQDYAGVYRQVPPSAKGAGTESAFTQDAQLQDQLDGQVRACAAIRNGKEANTWSQAPQTMTLQIARNHNYSGALTLSRDGLGWKIGALDLAALGPGVGAWEAAQRFCAALTAGDYATAYGALSRQGQADATKDQFVSAFSDALASSKAQIASCQLDVASYSTQPTAASVVAMLTVKATTVNGAVSAPLKVKFSLVNEADAWKLDRIQPFSGS
jgi:MecA-like transpeptidase family protein